MLNPVALTSLLVAAVRAEETQRPERLFDDPFAAALAGDAGRKVLADSRARTGEGIPILEVRTRFFDEAMLRAQGRGIRQVVILAAGMDARAFRLEWAPGTHVFEVDQPNVLRYKADILNRAPERCQRTCVEADLAADWSTPLLAAGFVRDQPSVWLVEGLSQYLPASAVHALFAGIDALACTGSGLLFDMVGETSLTLPVLAPVRAYMAELGAPWIFGCDAPESLLTSAWSVQVNDPAVVGNAWKRWPYPAIPGRRSGALVEAQKG